MNGTNSKFLVLLAMILWICQACSNTGVGRRYHSWDYKEIPDNGLVRVSVAAMKTPASTDKSLLVQLATDGQAALIQQVAKMVKSPDELFDKLGSAGALPPEQDVIDRCTFARRVVFAVSRRSIGENVSPTDRIQRIETTLKMNADTAVFDSWDRFETAYETMELGTLTRSLSTTRELAISGGGTTGTVTIGVNPRLSQTEGVSHTKTSKERYIKQNVEVTENWKEAVVSQEGADGIDLEGVSYVDFKIKVRAADKPIRVAKIGALEKDGKLIEASKVSARFCLLYHPRSIQSVTCSYDYGYIFRHVEKPEDREIDEGLQNVKFFGAKSKPKDLEILGCPDLRSNVYELMTENEMPVSVEGPIVKGMLFFAKYDEAVRFLEWVKGTRNTRFGRYELMVSGKKLRPAEIPGLWVRPKTLPEGAGECPA